MVLAWSIPFIVFFLVYFLLWFVWCLIQDSMCDAVNTIWQAQLYCIFMDIISCRMKIAGLPKYMVALCSFNVLSNIRLWQRFARCILAIHLRTNQFVNYYLWSWYAMLVCETFALICDCHVWHVNLCNGLEVYSVPSILAPS